MAIIIAAAPWAAEPGPGDPPETARVRPGPVYLTVLVIATCGLVYELVAGTLASYLLGDSVTQFSLVIGIYLTAMGVGAWLSKFVERGVARRFVEAEIAVALPRRPLGADPLLRLLVAPLVPRRSSSGSSSSSASSSASRSRSCCGSSTDSVVFKDLVAQVLTFDYLGALAASRPLPARPRPAPRPRPDVASSSAS